MHWDVKLVDDQALVNDEFIRNRGDVRFALDYYNTLFQNLYQTGACNAYTGIPLP